MGHQFLVDTYETERLKVLSVWGMFRDEDLPFRPHPTDLRGRSFLEQMQHQCLSENAWFCNMLGIDVGAPPLPVEETRLGFVLQYSDGFLKTPRCFEVQGDNAWWEEEVAFFEYRAAEPGSCRRIAHTSHIGANRWPCFGCWDGTCIATTVPRRIRAGRVIYLSKPLPS